MPFWGVTVIANPNKIKILIPFLQWTHRVAIKSHGPVCIKGARNTLQISHEVVELKWLRLPFPTVNANQAHISMWSVGKHSFQKHDLSDYMSKHGLLQYDKLCGQTMHLKILCVWMIWFEWLRFHIICPLSIIAAKTSCKQVHFLLIFTLLLRPCYKMQSTLIALAQSR
jgi:hypothetical protein